MQISSIIFGGLKNILTFAELNLIYNFMTRTSIFKTLGLVLIAGLAIVNFTIGKKDYNNQGFSYVTLKNIEALATESGESSGSKKSCFKTVTEAPNDNSLAISVTKCSSCKSVWATSSSDSDKCE
ncbi:MAG: hypothetical protein LBJ17_02795 [Dysgonamonadaceae bacterium]|jgi:hypothetical protein|nr:hypothetical protein [Dysgonamonadaceae bacterium]